MKKQCLFVTLLFVCCLLIPSCSINKMAIKAVSNALTKHGSSEVFTSDSDVELVADALPFAIKMYESLLEANSKHQGLLETAGSLYVMYANAFVQKPAEQMPKDKFAERQAAMDRAGKLYLRGLELLYRAFEQKYPGFSGAFGNALSFSDSLVLQNSRKEILSKMKKEDVPSLYWAAAGGISAFSLNPLDPGLSIRVFEFFSLIEHAYSLDPDFNSGALDDFLLLYYGSVPEIMGGSKALAEAHFKLAVEKSKGLLASPYVSYAQAVSIPAQDYDTFKKYLEAALAIDPDSDPANRLVNIINQRKARYLLDSAAQFFISVGANDFWDDWDNED